MRPWVCAAERSVIMNHSKFLTDLQRVSVKQMQMGSWLTWDSCDRGNICSEYGRQDIVGNENYSNRRLPYFYELIATRWCSLVRRCRLWRNNVLVFIVWSDILFKSLLGVPLAPSDVDHMVVVWRVLHRCHITIMWHILKKVKEVR